MDIRFFMVARVDIDAFEEFGEMLKRSAAPRYVHQTRASAEAEAERLAALNPGVEFMVLEGVAVVHAEAREISGKQVQVPIYQQPYHGGYPAHYS